MNNSKFEKLKSQVTQSLPNYNKYCELNDELSNKIKENEEYTKLKDKIKILSNIKKEILNEINKRLFEKGLDVNVDNIEKGVQMITAFCLDDYYFNDNVLPESINNLLIDNYYDDCYNGYLMILEFAKQKKLDKDSIYKVLANSFIYLYELIIEVYKENKIEGLNKYIKILALFRKNFGTSITAVNIDERFKKYVIYLTSNDSILNALNVYDLYLIMLCFGDDKFLDLVIQTKGTILNDIASLILRRKKDGITKEDEQKQLTYLSKNISAIPSREEKIIKL